MFEIRYVEFENKDWNYFKVETKNKIIIYINSRSDKR